MRATLPLSIMMASVFAFAGTACSRGMDGPPQSPKDWAALKGFTAIDATGPDNVIVTLGNAFSIRAEGDAKAVQQLDIHVEGDKLVVSRRSGASNLWGGDSGSATIRVSLPAISAVDLTGSGNVDVDRAEGKALDLDLTGSGNLKVTGIKVGTVKADLTGSGNVALAGQADDGRFSITGSGDIDADGLKVGKGDASILGSGDIAFASDGPVAINVMGSGDVTVKGKAQCTTSGSGSGETRCAP